MKIRQVKAVLFEADGRTDMTKPVVAFRNFAKASKKVENNIQFVVHNRISVIKFQILKFHYEDELVNVELRIVFLYVIR
jgi:hypothetical protein